MRLPHKCNIYTITTSKVNWATKQDDTIVYSNIECMFYKKKSITIQDSVVSRDTKTWDYEVILNPSKTLVREWYIIELVDRFAWSIGRYTINAIDMNYSLLSWSLDNIHFTCSKI